jgi:hypothetical protein
MAGMGPPPKPSHLRQRRNKVAGARTLSLAPELEKRERPELPPKPKGAVPWHPQTLRFWREVWASPMADEYLDSDIPGLEILADLVDRYWYGDAGLAAEIRLQRQCFGLTSLDRRRLQWEIARGEEATRRSGRGNGPARPRRSKVDPRQLLRAVE